MTDDQGDEPEQTGTIHLHRLATTDDWHRVRVILTALWAITDDDWRCDLQRDLLLEALFITTAACHIDITADDTF